MNVAVNPPVAAAPNPPAPPAPPPGPPPAPVTWLEERLRSPVLLFLLLMCQVGFQSFLMKKYYPKVDGKPKVDAATAGIVGEIIKVIIVVSFFRPHLAEGLRRIKIANSFKFAVAPAFIYSFQNFFIERGRVLLDGGTTFNIVNQCKILSSAIFVGIFIYIGWLRRPVLPRTWERIIHEWVAILAVCAAAIMFIIPDKLPNDKAAAPDATTVTDFASFLVLLTNPGLMFTLAATILSGLSTAFSMAATENVIPVPGNPAGYKRTPFVSTAEMAIYQTSILIIYIIISNYQSQKIEFLKFENWTLWTLIPIIINSCGGLIVGCFFALPDGGILKNFAVVAGLVVTAILDWYLGKDFTTTKKLAGIMFLLSLLLYQNLIPQVNANIYIAALVGLFAIYFSL